MRVALAAVVCLALTLDACQAATPSIGPSPSLPLTDLSSVRLPTPTPTAAPPTPSPAPTPTATPTLAPPTPSPTPIELGPTPTPTATLTPAPDCINGWIAPAPDSAEYQAALDMIESQMAATGPWNVDEMRYFTGPDVPWIIDPHYDVVQYWYVRASRADQADFAARWLLEQRTDLIRGISAVARYDSTGYQSPDWTGFTGDGTPQIYAGLPGEWSGIPYDFVTGEGDSGMPGLPDQVIGCLSGT